MSRVSPATADVAGQRLLAVVLGRIWIFIQKGFGRDYETGSAIAALHCVPFAVGLDQISPFGIRGDSLNRFNRFTFAFNSKCCAREDCPAIDDHGAGAANSAVAHLLGAGQAKLELERALEGPVRLEASEGSATQRKSCVADFDV